MLFAGLMIFAKTPHAQRHIGLQFEKRQTKKLYIAWVEGIVEDAKGVETPEFKLKKKLMLAANDIDIRISKKK